MMGLSIRNNSIVSALCLGLCFTTGYAFHKYGADAFHKYVGTNARTFVTSPAAYLRARRRG